MTRPENTGRRAYTIRNFGAAYGVGRSKTFEEIRAGRLAAVKCGHTTLIPADAAEAWFATLPAVNRKTINDNSPGARGPEAGKIVSKSLAAPRYLKSARPATALAPPTESEDAEHQSPHT